MKMNQKQMLQELSRRCQQREPGMERAAGRPSAVLIPLIRRGEEFDVLFEKRASQLDVQPGEICFPGGGIEPGETPFEAAVRETEEELLISEDQIDVIASMRGVAGPTGAPLWPFVGCLSGYRNTFSKDEVDHVFTVPLQWFLEHDSAQYEVEMITKPGEDFPFELIPGGRNYCWRPRTRTIHFYQTGQEVIWGVTAWVMHSFVCELKSYLAAP